MFKMFSSSDGEELLIRTVNQWLTDDPNISVQSFNYHTYYRPVFGGDDELIHCLILNYTMINPSQR